MVKINCPQKYSLSSAATLTLWFPWISRIFPKLDSLSQVLVPGLAKTGQREAFSKRLLLFILTHLMKGARMSMFLRICFYFILQHYFYTQLKIPPFNLPRLGMVPDVVQQKPTHRLLSDQQSFL